MVIGNKEIEINLKNLFTIWSGFVPEKISQLPLSGSNRIYYRIQSKEISAIGVYNNNKKENLAFIDFTHQFHLNRINVPDIYIVDTDQDIYLISDLGDLQLLEWLNGNGFQSNKTNEAIHMYKKVINELIRMQIIAGKHFDYSNAYSFSEFNKEAIIYDLDYFKTKFADVQNLKYNSSLIILEFDFFSEYLLTADSNFFLYRDFQARNILLVNNEPFFIDYQGGKKGALQYDLASLLFQAKAQIPEHTREYLLNYYIDIAQLYTPILRNQFTTLFYAFALVRVLQTLGAYGLRGIIEKKKHFLESIPYAIINLKYLKNQVRILEQLPELNKLIETIINLEYNEYE